MTEPTLSVVVTTLGRLEALKKLLDSLAGQLAAGDEIALVAQRNEADVAALAASVNTAATVIATTSARGACLGRNTGVAAGSGDVLLFPNDTTWFPEGTIAAIRTAASQHPVLAYMVRDDAGAKFNFDAATAEVTYQIPWQVIEPGMAIHRADFEAVGGFNTDFGPGAPTPYQAGEGADLLFRWHNAYPEGRIRFEPSIVVGGVTDSAGLSPKERRRKLRAYGRGCGHIMTTHKNPLWFRTAYIMAGVALPLLRRGQYGPLDGFPTALGRFEGVTGIMFGRGYNSVTR